jgi:uncharacterized protein YecE (DUF72 family)
MNVQSEPLIGSCGWAGPQLQYFSQFPVIEIQSTFYDPPASKVAARWRTNAPAEFGFCIKAWRLITHSPSRPTYRRLRKPIDTERSAFFGSLHDTDEVWEAWMKTLEIAEAVRASGLVAGIVLFQCPASFRASRLNIANLFPLLSEDCAAVIPAGMGAPWAVACRSRSRSLRAIRLIHCV